MISYFKPKAGGVLVSDIDELSRSFGTKGAFLAAIPQAWTPIFTLLDVETVRQVAKETLSISGLPPELDGHPIIVRSSIVGETIWERGTYLSIPFLTPPSEAQIEAAIREVSENAERKTPGCQVAIILQRYVSSSDKGTLGNLNRLSKTREQWTKFSESTAFSLSPDRFNSQRDTSADPRRSLSVGNAVQIDRVFGSACRWLIDRFSAQLGRDRMLIEWLISEGNAYLVQCDLDCDNSEGVDPSEEKIINKLTSSLVRPNLLRMPTEDDVQQWDKLKILDDLSTDFAPLPQSLYFLPFTEAERILGNENERQLLSQEFDSLFGVHAVIRVSRRAGADKTTNLPCSSKCLDGSSAVEWMAEQIHSHSNQGGDVHDRAFVIHKFIGARSGAWALFDPESSYVHIHANWGLPDSLQYFPYDAWDFHIVTEEVNAHPTYKTDFLWPQPNGEWSLKQIKNSVARHQSLKAHEVIEIAKKTRAIGNRLARTVAVMWFAGVEGADGEKFCIPWYRTFEYALPDKDSEVSSDHVIRKISSPDDLLNADAFAETLPVGRKLALDIQPTLALIRDPDFLDEIIKTAQKLNATVIYSGSPFSHPYFQLHGKVPLHLNLSRRTFRTRHLIKYHKLVRDLIPEKVKSRHERVVFANLNSGEILQLLSGKLVEEAHELISAESLESSAEELADVYEVLRAMMHQVGVDEKRVVEIADMKRDKVGGFDKGIFLLETSLPKPGEANVEIRNVGFDNLVKEDYVKKSIRIPLAMLGRLTEGPSKIMPFPGSDKGLRIEMAGGAILVSLEQLEHQLQLDLAEADDDDDEWIS